MQSVVVKVVCFSFHRPIADYSAIVKRYKVKNLQSVTSECYLHK